jgi:hypothetical protein
MRGMQQLIVSGEWQAMALSESLGSGWETSVWGEPPEEESAGLSDLGMLHE